MYEGIRPKKLAKKIETTPKTAKPADPMNFQPTPIRPRTKRAPIIHDTQLGKLNVKPWLL